jgi:hypothetical protein
MQGKGETRSDAPHPNPIEYGVGGSPLESATEEIDLVTGGRDSSEHLMEVQLRPPCVRVLAILPIDDQNAHDGVTLSA